MADLVENPRSVRALSVVSAAGRIAIGVGLALAPAKALGALGFADASPAIVTIARLAGGRDIVLGATTLLAIDDVERLRQASLANATVDGGDAAAFATALTMGDEVRAGALRGLAAAIPATLASLWVARRLS